MGFVTARLKMYKSELDDERRLEIPYDPIRRYNGATTMEDWDAYPYKSVSWILFFFSTVEFDELEND